MADQPPKINVPEGPPQPQQVPLIQGPGGAPMLPPTFLPEVVHTMEWADPGGNAGVCLIISNFNGITYHFWDHDMALEIARNVRKTAEHGSGLVEVHKKLVLPTGVQPSAPPR
jgi:hypothetical protein